MENYALYILLGGIAVAAVGALWLLVASIQQWGWWAVVFPFLALFFPFAHWRKGLFPFLLVLIGAGATVFPAAYNHFFPTPIDLGPYERTVDGEVHLTLTGWDRQDYSPLKDRADVVVLQMANGDVTDEILTYLTGMTHLRELDLSRTKVTDEGLKTIAQLPHLETLRLTGVPITDKGLLDNLMDIQTLKKLDLQETIVSADARKAWRKKLPGRATLPR